MDHLTDTRSDYQCFFGYMILLAFFKVFVLGIGLAAWKNKLRRCEEIINDKEEKGGEEKGKCYEY